MLQAIFRILVKAVKRGHEDSLLEEEADSPDWLDDNDNDELDKEEQSLLEEFMSPEKEAQDDAELDDLLEALENLQELEAEDGSFGRNAVMKVM